MYEEINSVFVRLDLTAQTANKCMSICIDVLFIRIDFGFCLVVIDIHRMADADNRVILNVGGIRHETCMYLTEHLFSKVFSSLLLFPRQSYIEENTSYTSLPSD